MAATGKSDIVAEGTPISMAVAEQMPFRPYII
jgi:hypothetical protein